MLPLLEKVHASPLINNFYRDIHYLFGIPGGFPKDGVCAGIAIDWIKHHSQKKMDAFVNQINDPTRIYMINEMQTLYNAMEIKAIKDYFHFLNLEVVSETIHSNFVINHKDISQIITSLNGYLLLCFAHGGEKVGHAVAISNTDRSCEFFDSNYGSAFFTPKSTFLFWYQLFSWDNPIGKHPNPYNFWHILQLKKSR